MNTDNTAAETTPEMETEPTASTAAATTEPEVTEEQADSSSQSEQQANDGESDPADSSTAEEEEEILKSSQETHMEYERALSEIEEAQNKQEEEKGDDAKEEEEEKTEEEEEAVVPAPLPIVQLTTAPEESETDSKGSISESESLEESSKVKAGTRYFVLESTQGDRYSIDMRAKWQMETLAKVNTKNTKEFVIPMVQMPSGSLKRVVAWAEHHHKTREVCLAWEEKFFDGLDVSVLFDFVTAANALGMKHFLMATNNALEKKLRGQTSEELKLTFGIPLDKEPEKKRNYSIV